MECTQRADGEYVFTRRIHIAPGREYQFKFRKGDHDWVLDENSRIGERLAAEMPSTN